MSINNYFIQVIYFAVSYEQSAITYVWKNDEDTLRKSPSLTTLNAYLIQNATTACPIKASWRGKHIHIFFYKFIILCYLYLYFTFTDLCLITELVYNTNYLIQLVAFVTCCK